MGLLHYGPVTRSPSFSDGFVNGLQNGKFPSRPAIQATGLGLLPRWDLLPLIMPAFAGRTVFEDLSCDHSRKRCACAASGTGLTFGPKQRRSADQQGSIGDIGQHVSSSIDSSYFQ